MLSQVAEVVIGPRKIAPVKMLSRLLPHIESLRETLAQRGEEIASMVREGRSGREVAAAVASARDDVVLTLWNRYCEEAADGRSSGTCLLALGAYARRRLCPYSDVDLLLMVGDDGDRTAISRMCEPFFRDLYDVGLEVGFSIRGMDETCRAALEDPHLCTSLLQVRLLSGDSTLLHDWYARWLRWLRRNSGRLIREVIAARNRERAEYGDTVYLLEPNVKRSPGTLRDIHFLEWIAALRFQGAGLEGLVHAEVITPDEVAGIRDAEDFLLRLRQSLHCAAGKADDVLSRAAQWSVARDWGFSTGEGLLGVERFMREYFRVTERLDTIRERIVAYVEPRRSIVQKLRGIVGKRIGAFAMVAGDEIVLTRAGKRGAAGNYDRTLSLLEAALRHGATVSPGVWHWMALHRDAFPSEPTESERSRFWSLLGHTVGLPGILRHLHALGLLERFLPAFGPARGLLQFNQYHKFTVDQHSLIALKCAVGLERDQTLLGRTYSAVQDKAVLHAAILLHDMGKGREENHCTVGARIAAEVAERFQLPEDRAELLVYLVENHLRMNHLALRRDLSDEKLVVDFAVEAGSPERLRMLYVLTAVDLMAVGPDNWTGWKSDLLAELYQRAMRCISDSGDVIVLGDEALAKRRQEILDLTMVGSLGEGFRRLVWELPHGYVLSGDPQRIAEDLKLLSELGARPVALTMEFVPATQCMVWTVATKEEVAEGIFHRLTGALTSRGLAILSAQIHTLPKGLILDRFWVQDCFHRGEPPPDRLNEIRQQVLRSLLSETSVEPVFRERWRPARDWIAELPRAALRVEIDNASLPDFTIIEVFTYDRAGLLYRIARTLFEEGCSVWRAKVGTYLDQVVDVFYVTGRGGAKLTDAGLAARLKARLLEVIRGGQD